MADPPAATPSTADLLARAAGVRRASDDTGVALVDHSARQDIADRAHFAATVSSVFLICLPVALVVLLVLSFMRADAATEAVKAVVEILKSVLLPIMTLVLGYYFARAKG